MGTPETFMGYKRADGRVGIRNRIAVLPTVGCANGVVDAICRAVPEAVNLSHQHGCGRLVEKDMHRDTFIGMGSHPNFFGTLVVGLGCEVIGSDGVFEAIRETGKRVAHLKIQEDGGTQKTAAKGIEIASAMLEEAQRLERTEQPLSDLIIGLECGASDALSGITANPAIGKVSDWIVGQGGTSVITETTEFIGLENTLKNRFASEEVRTQLLEQIAHTEEETFSLLGKGAGRVISPGNMEGGMSTIQEKSLGCIKKGGSTPFVEFVTYGVKPSRKGLVIMDGPGFDIESLTGLFAGGAQFSFFSTGRGSPIGHPGMPIIKVSSNSALYEKMKDDMDVNAGALLEGKSLDDIADDLISEVIAVINGKETKSEINRQEGLLAIYSYSRAF